MQLKPELLLPGMLERSERSLLFEKSFSMPNHHIAIEFGAFLGASTACIAYGLRRSGNTNKINTFDLFSCGLTNVYSIQVEQVAKKIGCNLKVKTFEKKSYYDYKHITSKLLQSFDNIILNQVNIQDSGDVVRARVGDKKIGLLHLDAPKDWMLLKSIFESTLKNLGEGSWILEQDFYFECAPTIILTFYYLEINNFCLYAGDAASTAVFRWQQKFGHDCCSLIDEVDKFMLKLKNDRDFMIYNLFNCSRLYSRKNNLSQSQKQALNIALFNFILSSDFEENFKVEWSARLLEESGVKINGQFSRKLARTLSRAYTQSKEIFLT